MKRIDKSELPALLKQAGIGPRLRGEIRYDPLSIIDWEDRDFVALSTRSGNEGVFIFEVAELYTLPFNRKVGIVNATTGKTKPILCDFCYTWQRGGNAATITFCPKGSNRTTTFLCCADLLCSLHVRSKTAAALESRTQLKEDMDADRRIARMRAKLEAIMQQILLPD